MGDIDLIPQAYRTRRWQVLWLKYSAFLLVAFLGVGTIGLMLLNSETAEANSRVVALQAQQQAAAQQRVRLQGLSAERTELEEQFDLLSGLRSGAPAQDMFEAIDRALTSDDLWFVEWQFERAGVMVKEGTNLVNTGYFIVVPNGSDTGADGAVRVQTNMTIRGQSRDHSALSEFVRRLFAQDEIDDVRIRKTVVNNSGQANAVDFELSVILKTDVQAGL